MIKKRFMIIVLSIILLTGCNTTEVKSANKLGYINDYTNVSYVEGKTNNINEKTTQPTTTITTTTTTTVNTVPVDTTTTTSNKIVDTTTTNNTTTTTTTTKKKTTTTTKVTTTQKVEDKPVYTGPTTSELIDEANAYITKYRDKINEMISLINIERAKEGLDPLEYDYQLTLAATIRALEMHYTGVFEHARYCPNNTYDASLCRKWSTIFSDLHITYNRAAENIARGYSRVDKAMNGFMNSESHRANIMNPKLKYVGIGVAEYSSVSYYYAQEFKG